MYDIFIELLNGKKYQYKDCTFCFDNRSLYLFEGHPSDLSDKIISYKTEAIKEAVITLRKD